MKKTYKLVVLGAFELPRGTINIKERRYRAKQKTEKNALRRCFEFWGDCGRCGVSLLQMEDGEALKNSERSKKKASITTYY